MVFLMKNVTGLQINVYRKGGKDMEFEYLKANIFQLIMNLTFSLFALLAGIFAFRFIDKYIFTDGWVHRLFHHSNSRDCS